VKRIMDTLQRHMPVAGQDGVEELLKIAWRFEEKIFQAATDQQDYLRKISLKMLSLETKGNGNALQARGAGGVPGQVAIKPDPAGQYETKQGLMIDLLAASCNQLDCSRLSCASCFVTQLLSQKEHHNICLSVLLSVKLLCIVWKIGISRNYTFCSHIIGNGFNVGFMIRT
jgi:hypothetical protein